jgi:hypothetical protein
VERVRRALWLALDAPPVGLGRPGRDHVEQAVGGADEPVIVRLHHDGIARGADAGIDHADEDRCPGKAARQRRQHMGRGTGVETRRIVQQVDNGADGTMACEGGVELADIRAGEPEIGEQGDHAGSGCGQSL